MFEGPGGMQLQRALTIAGWVLVAFLGVLTLSTIKGLSYIGAGVQPANTINVSGHGEYLAVPDIATFSFSVVSDKATVADAQADATAKANAITGYLTGAGINKNDIQTSDYSISPQYEYQSVVCPAGSYCPGGRQTLKGYEVRQTTTIKVRDTSKAGELLAGVGGKGATEVSGLNFTFDDPDVPQEQARDKAIADAKTKAEALAKSLGVSLVRIVSFNESGSPRAYPMAYGLGGVAMDSKAAAPEISVGQNKIVNDVSITYEIR